MSLLALSAATAYYPDPTFTNLTLPGGTAPTGKTGFTFPNSPAGLVYAVINMGSSASNYTIVGVNGASVGPTALTTSAPNIIGPFNPGLYSNSSGLVTIDLSSVTGITGVAVVMIPALGSLSGGNPLHNPFESVAGAPDS
jgi:hypothetical protein